MGTWAVEALTSNTVVFVIFTVMLLTVGAYMNNRETRKVKLERMKAKAKGRNKARFEARDREHCVKCLIDV